MGLYYPYGSVTPQLSSWFLRRTSYSTSDAPIRPTVTHPYELCLALTSLLFSSLDILFDFLPVASLALGPLYCSSACILLFYLLTGALSVAYAQVYQGFNYGSVFTNNAPITQQDYENEFNTAKQLQGTSGFTSARIFTMIQVQSIPNV